MTDAGRWRGNDDVGKSHGGIPPPIWHPGKAEGGKAYPGTDRQAPPSYDQTKFSKSIKGPVANMPSTGYPQGKSKDDSAAKKDAATRKEQRPKSFPRRSFYDEWYGGEQ